MSLLQNLFAIFLLIVLLVGISSGDELVSSFSASPVRGHAPLTVAFSDLSSGSPSGWAWYFGDENYTGKEWKEQNTSVPWGQRFGSAMVAMPDGTILLMGGGGGYKNDIWKSSDKGVTWTLQNGTPSWPGREFHSAVVMPDKSIVLMGGFNGSYFNDVWRSTDQGVTWTLQVAHAPWAARAKHTSVALLDGSILLMGGFDGNSPRNDVWRSSDKGVTWTRMTPSADWNARFGLAGIVLPDGRIAVTGGRTTSSYFQELWFSIDQGATWTFSPLLNLTLFYPRSYHAAAALPDGNILIVSGEASGNTVNDMVRLVNRTGSWLVERYEIPTPIARYYHAGVILPDGGLVLSGGVNKSTIKNDVQYFGTATLFREPVHIYQAEGTYSVTLQVYGTDGFNKSTRKDYITVYSPLPPPTITEISPATGKNITASLAVNISGTNFDTINPPSVRLSRPGHPDIIAENVFTHSSSQITCSISLNGCEAGAWDVIVTNPDGKTGVLPAGFFVNQSPPKADFFARPVSGTAPLLVEFTDNSTGFPTTWKWDFGDGVTSSERNPLHTYISPGTYTVTLTVQNGGGNSTLTNPDFISVKSAYPPVIVAFSPASMVHGKTVNVAIIGKYIQEGASAGLIQGTIKIPITVKSVTPPSKMAGIVTIPASARGRWSLVVKNPDGGECIRANAIVIS